MRAGAAAENALVSAMRLSRSAAASAAALPAAARPPPMPPAPEAATNLALPRARFHENVAAAYSAVEAAHLVEDSPGHLRNLLCPTCTHASIGVALEPALGRQPRLFVTWELLEFPEGEPQRIMR